LDQTIGGPGRHLLISLLAATLFVGMFYRLGGYRLAELRLHWQLTRTLITWGVTVSALLLVAFLTKTSAEFSRGWVFAWIIAAPLALLIGRCVVRGVIATRGGSYVTRNVVIVGAGKEGQQLIAQLQAAQDGSIAVRGVFDDRSSRLPAAVHGFDVLGTTDDLLDFVRQVPTEEVIIALPLDAERRLKALCEKLKMLAVDVRLSAQPLAEKLQFRGMSYVGVVPVLEVVDHPLKNWCGILKLIEDKAIAALLLIFLAPLIAIIAFLIKLESPGPIFFVQKRFGFNNEVIGVLKFRSMYSDRGDLSGAQRTVQNDPRVTPLGRYLRLLSLDELPQLINVLRGEMSLVGPRAHPVAMRTGGRFYWEAVEEYLHRHRVRPGITGWAQVNGLRGEVDTLEKARARLVHDLYYIDHWSLWFDLKVMLMTVGILASRQNAY
jgi:Undecaprenyl-phosphate glucose phosphotransferase